MQSKLSTALTAELIGTFALVFIGAGAAALGIGGLVGVALAHGLVIVTFTYAYGHLSGAHLNPAVTIGLWAGGQIRSSRAAGYVVAQLLGGIAGAMALRLALGGASTGLGATLLATGLQVGDTTVVVTPAAGLLIETLLTFFLVSTVFNAAVSGRAGNLAGLAIGLALTFGILMGGPLTGASLNPARTLGPALVTGNHSDLWVYIVGPIAGGVLAALLYRGALQPEG
jgi:aquaporin Z